MTGARNLSEEAWSLSLKSWQEPVPFGMQRGYPGGKGQAEVLLGFPVRLPAILNGHQAAGGAMHTAQVG